MEQGKVEIELGFVCCVMLSLLVWFFYGSNILEFNSFTHLQRNVFVEVSYLVVNILQES